MVLFWLCAFSQNITRGVNDGKHINLVELDIIDDAVRTLDHFSDLVS
jgi:hypothetical protein